MSICISVWCYCYQWDCESDQKLSQSAVVIVAHNMWIQYCRCMNTSMICFCVNFYLQEVALLDYELRYEDQKVSRRL